MSDKKVWWQVKNDPKETLDRKSFWESLDEKLKEMKKEAEEKKKDEEDKKEKK